MGDADPIAVYDVCNNVANNKNNLVCLLVRSRLSIKSDCKMQITLFHTFTK